MITTRKGIVVGLKDDGECSEKNKNGVAKKNDENEGVKKEKEQNNEVEEKVVSKEEKQRLKKPTTNKSKVVLDHPPVQHLPYPHAPLKKDKER